MRQKEGERDRGTERGREIERTKESERPRERERGGGANRQILHFLHSQWRRKAGILSTWAVNKAQTGLDLVKCEWTNKWSVALSKASETINYFVVYIPICLNISSEMWNNRRFVSIFIETSGQNSRDETTIFRIVMFKPNTKCIEWFIDFSNSKSTLPHTHTHILHHRNAWICTEIHY